MKLTVKDLARCGLLAALTAVMSQLSIPIQPIPFSFGIMGAMLSGLLLGSKKGMLSQIAYLLMGMFGLPVFTGWKGGLGVIAGPTGGYLLGYIALAGICGLVFSRTAGKKRSYRLLVGIVGVVLGTMACYLLGTTWLMIATGSTFVEAFMLGVAPFAVFDLIKAGLAVPFALLVEPVMRRAQMKA